MKLSLVRFTQWANVLQQVLILDFPKKILAHISTFLIYLIYLLQLPVEISSGT